MLFKILRELLPHLTRLAPVAQTMLNARSGSENTLAELSTTVRRDLGQVTSANTSLHRQLEQQGELLEELHGEVSRIAPIAINTSKRLDAMEEHLESLVQWTRAAVMIGTVAAVLSAAVLILLLMKH